MNIKESIQTLDIFVISIYVGVLLFIGFYTSLKRRKSTDLFLADRSLKWHTIGFSIFGTNVSPSMMIASCAIAYSSGMVAANFEWLACGFLFILSMIFIPHYLNTKISTMPEFMEKRFDSRCRRFQSYYTLFTILILWLGGILYAGGLLLCQITGWDLWLSVTLLMIISAGFTITGGLAAVAYTDNFNSILMILVSLLLVVLGFLRIGSLNNLLTAIPDDYWHLFRPMDDPTLPWHAILLGYPVLGIWFWCTDQTIVQRVLGAKDIKQGQLGSIFAGYLKILTPIMFFLPGIFCFVLFPNLQNADTAYMTMVTNVLPVGGVGLSIAVLIAALVSTVDAALNSFSTVFTIDIYIKYFRPNATGKETRSIGQLVTLFIAILGIFIALFMNTIGRDLFNLLQGIIAFFAPPMSAVFLIGVLWRKATSRAALITLVAGSIISLTIGACQLKNFPYEGFWPHYMLLSFYLFVILSAMMIIFSLITKEIPGKESLPTLKEAYSGAPSFKLSNILWVILGLIMISLYIIFN